jgi:hypothetical protein
MNRMNLATSLITASAAIIFALGLAHLAFTFRGTRLHPRDAQLQAAMKEVSMVITRQTTVWKAWIGFNASHSVGAILFGVVYGYLAITHGTFLLQSTPLLLVGFAFLIGFVVLAKIYWFSTPFRGIGLATALYVAGLIVGWT